MIGCVYVLHALSTNYYKIGRTTNIKKRVEAIQSQIPFFEIDLVVAHHHKMYKEIEKRMHWIYEECQLKGSEWFELSDDDIATATMDTSDLVIYLGLTLSIKENNNPVSTECEILGEKILLLYKELGTWERVGWHYGLPRITVWRIANDKYEPMRKDIREILGLPHIKTIPQVRNGKSGQFSKRSE